MLSLCVTRYVCYLEYSPLIRLTGCWYPSLEFHEWSNVVCVLEGSGLEDVMQDHATTVRQA